MLRIRRGGEVCWLKPALRAVLGGTAKKGKKKQKGNKATEGNKERSQDPLATRSRDPLHTAFYRQCFPQETCWCALNDISKGSFPSCLPSQPLGIPRAFTQGMLSVDPERPFLPPLFIRAGAPSKGPPVFFRPLPFLNHKQVIFAPTKPPRFTPALRGEKEMLHRLSEGPRTESIERIMD